MMTLWCLFGSPLMLGAELTKLDGWTLSLLTNPRVLSMLTPACRPWQLERDECHAVWAAENAQAGGRYIALFNLADQPAALSASLAGIWPGCTAGQELWTGEPLSVQGGAISVQVPAHGCKVYRV